MRIETFVLTAYNVTLAAVAALSNLDELLSTFQAASVFVPFNLSSLSGVTSSHFQRRSVIPRAISHWTPHASFPLFNKRLNQIVMSNVDTTRWRVQPCRLLPQRNRPNLSEPGPTSRQAISYTSNPCLPKMVLLLFGSSMHVQEDSEETSTAKFRLLGDIFAMAGPI
jgi:hypothetical protein